MKTATNVCMTIIAVLTLSACGKDEYDADYLASLQGGASSTSSSNGTGNGYVPVESCPSSCEIISLQHAKLRTGLAPSKSILGVNNNGGVCVCPTGSGGATSTGGTSSNWPSGGCIEGVECNRGGGSSQDVATGGTSSLGVGGGSTQDPPATGGSSSTGGGSSQDVATGGTSSLGVGGGSTQDPPSTGGTSPATGGTTSIAGSSSVGGGSTQDPPATGGGSSQDVATGGRSSTGGQSSIAGSSAVGGGSTQDPPPTGGKSGTGGGSTQDPPATGGKASTGGQSSTGGSPATGGNPSTGGSVGTGGTTSQDCTPQQYKFWITNPKQDLGVGTVFITNERTGEVIQTSCGDSSSCCYYDIPNSCDAWLIYETTGASKMPRVPSLNTTTNTCEFIWGTMPRITTGDHIDLVEGVDYTFVIGNDGKCSMRLVPFAGTWYYN